MNESKTILEEVTDPAEVARINAVHEQGKRNSDWLGRPVSVPFSTSPEGGKRN
jgi:hypothetical protein